MDNCIYLNNNIFLWFHKNNLLSKNENIDNLHTKQSENSLVIYEPSILSIFSKIKHLFLNLKDKIKLN